MSLTEISRHTGLNKSKVYKIIQRYEERGEHQPQRRGGDRRSVLDAEEKEFLNDLVAQDATITLREIQNKIFERCS